MKKALVFFISFLVLISCQIPNNVISFNKKLIDIVKDNSLYSDSLDWNSIQEEIKTLSRDFKSAEQCSVVVKHIIKKLKGAGDFHSSYGSREEANKMASQNLNNLKPEAKYLGDNIGYIKVPGFESVNESVCNGFATEIQTLIKAIDSFGINGWIVDLRGNTGGNMYPMIAGLGPLTGEGTLGYFIDKKGETSPWSYQNGSCDEVKVQKPYTIKIQNSKIAVLINEKTASSGEMTTISFIGKPNVKLFGQPSGGYTTANSGFELPDGSFIYLAVAFTADRNSKKYSKKINPDFYAADITNTDNCIKVATEWLKEK